MRRERQKTKRVGIHRDENDETEEPIATKSCDKIHNINFKSKSAYIKANIGLRHKFIRTDVLIDTGADFNVIDARLLKQLRAKGINCPLLKPQRRPPVAANNQPLKLLGDCELDLKISSDCKTILSRRIRFQVLGNLSTLCILGINTLRELGLYVKEDTIEIGGLKICQLTNSDHKINLIDSYIDEDGSRWGVYADSLVSLENNYSAAAKHVVSLDEDPVGSTSSVYEPREMQPGKYLVNLNDKDVPTELYINKTEQTSWLNELKNCNEKPKRKLITDETIAEMVQKSNFSNDGKKKLTRILEKFRSVFSSSKFDVGKFTGGKAKLKFKKGKEDPVFVPTRRIPHSMRDKLAEHLKEMETNEIITKTKASSWNSPLFFVAKKDKSWRPVSDFRALNKQLEDVYFPIPFITDLLDSLHGTKYFSSVDLRSGFYNIELDEESTDCTAFSALGQTYKYRRLGQGIKTSPILFQQIMTELFQDDKSCLVYMDDVLVASKTEDEALNDIQRLLERFLNHGFLLNPAKCIFGSKKLDYLGYEISQDGWTINKSKVTDLLNVKPPSSTTEVRSFTGLCNFYLNCIPNLQRLLRPLHQLTGKKKFVWSDEAQKAFDLAKKKLAEATVMAFPSMKKEDTYYLTTDASDNGWGGCLSQFQSDLGYEVPLSFSSGSFCNSELNWPIKEKEMFSFVKNLRLYETYLFGRRFCWRTDNRALSYFLSESVIKSTALKSCTPKVSRWIDFVNEFDFSIEHHQGTTDVMGGPDYLSRKSEIIATLAERKFDLNNLWLYSGCTVADMIDGQNNDGDLKNFRNGYSPLKSKKLYNLSTYNGIMVAQKVNCSDNLVIVPRNLIDDVLSFYHGIQHSGILNMTKKISAKFFIPNMTQAIANFTKNCVECVRSKGLKRKLDRPILQTSSKHPWMAVSADLIGPFPQSYNDNQYCLVVIDNLTRWTEIRPIKTKHAKSVADAFMDIFTSRGLPLSLLCDNGKEFYNLGLKKMFEKLGTNLQYTTPYRPQSNGITERCNQKVKKLLRLWDIHDATWDQYIGKIQFLINNEYNRILNMSAFQAIHGWTLSRLDFLKSEDIENLKITDFDSKQWAQQHSVRMAKMLGDLYVNDVQQKTQRYKKAQRIYDKSIPVTNGDIPSGAHVLIQFPQAPGSSKLANNWKGTYVIINQVDKNVYLVSHSEGQRRKMLVHKSRIKLLPKDRETRCDQDRQAAGSGDKVFESEKEQKFELEKVQESGQLRKTDEHPTVVKGAQDHSDKKHLDLKLKKKITDEKPMAPNQHAMKLRKRR